MEAEHDRSTEAEIHHILDATVRPPERLLLGTALAALGRRAGLSDEDIDAFAQVRNKTPAEPLTFERVDALQPANWAS